MGYQPHPLFSLPRPSTKIWRYMNFSKYISLLKKRSLWFCRTDRFVDNHEGSLSVPTAERFELHDKSLGKAKELREFARSMGYRSYEEMARVRRYQTRKDTALNCWHISDRESAALWELYSSEEGVAICSTIGRLMEALRDCEDKIYIGKVRYIDYSTYEFPEDVDRLAPYIHKRLSFHHERELRVIIRRQRSAQFEPGIKSPGMYVPVDLKRLLANVFVSPRGPRWFYDLVCSVSNQLGIRRSLVAQSSMRSAPIY